MCFSNSDWKREEVPDHKFDFIDVAEYESKNFLARIRYLWVYIVVLKSVLVYMSDLYTAGNLLAFNHWATVQPKIPLNIARWIFAGTIIFSVLLLLWDMRKARAIIASRDISYAFTSIIAYRYYTLRSYAHYCFFRQIDNSKRTRDNMIYFVFFTFKGWKRLLVAEGPRQVINALTLKATIDDYLKGKDHSIGNFFTTYFTDPQRNLLTNLVLISMAFTVIIFAISAIQLAIAFVLYIPLVCYIQGNLKEYCCHMIDKRIAELIRKKQRKRIKKAEAQARKEAMGDFRHLKGKKGEYAITPKQQPTLPKVAVYESNVNDSDSGFYDAPPPGHDSAPYGHDSYGADSYGEMAPPGHYDDGPPPGHDLAPPGHGLEPPNYDNRSHSSAAGTQSFYDVYDMYQDPTPDPYSQAQPHPYLDYERSHTPASHVDVYNAQPYQQQPYEGHAYPPPPPSRVSDRSYSRRRPQQRYDEPVDRNMTPFAQPGEYRSTTPYSQAGDYRTTIPFSQQGDYRTTTPHAMPPTGASFLHADRDSIVSAAGAYSNHHELRRGLTQAIQRERIENDAQWEMQAQGHHQHHPGQAW